MDNYKSASNGKRKIFSFNESRELFLATYSRRLKHSVIKDQFMKYAKKGKSLCIRLDFLNIYFK